MAHPSPAEQALKDGDAKAALKLLSEQIRSQPQDAKLRVFLFQLLCVSGQWQRALNQLNVALELDAGMLPMVQTYREAIACEALRMKVFAGEKVPMLFGEPEPWVALLIEALLREGQGDLAAGRRLRAQALEQAPASAGQINEQPFEWIADADSRLGPVIEAIINGKYYWLPWNRIERLELDPPQDLRDAVWMPGHFVFTNGGEVVGLIPTRYPDTDLERGDALALSRATEWRARADDEFTGLGQRLWATDHGDLALMDVRTVVLSAPVDGAEGADQASAAS